MRNRFVAVLVAALTPWVGQAGAQQQKPAEAPRVARTFDPAAIRRQAAQIAEFRALLSDPDGPVRLLAMREAIANGDGTQRGLAIEAGLASNESVMLDAALKGILANTHQIIIEFIDKEGNPSVDGNTSSIRLTANKFDIDTGHIEGKTPCNNGKGWSGQLQGTVFSFIDDSYICNGTLKWSADTGDFRGRVNFTNGQSAGNRNAVWKPR